MSRHARSDELLWHEGVLREKDTERRPLRRRREANVCWVTRLLRALNRLISR
jgi:hypothetical protein